MIDPNLITIRDANLDLIKQNDLRQTIRHARDYLTNILTPVRQRQIRKELNEFIDYVKGESNEIKSRSTRSSQDSISTTERSSSTNGI